LNFILGLLPRKTIWSQEDSFRPDFRRAEGFNETYRPLGWHHIISTVYEEEGECLGYYGMWRTVDQKPYSREDIQFLRESAPHISHGLRAAQLLSRDTTADAASFAPLPGWGAGMVFSSYAKDGGAGAPPPSPRLFLLRREQSRKVIGLRDLQDTVNHAGTGGQGASAQVEVAQERSGSLILESHAPLLIRIRLKWPVVVLVSGRRDRVTG
jgi:hypothetical protein